MRNAEEPLHINFHEVQSIRLDVDADCQALLR